MILCRLKVPIVFVLGCILNTAIYFGLTPSAITTEQSISEQNVLLKPNDEVFQRHRLRSARQDVIMPLTASPYDGTFLIKVMAERRKTLADACNQRYYWLNRSNKLQSAIHSIAGNHFVNSALLVDDTNHLIHCVIAKVASTNMKKLLLFNSANSSFTDPDIMDPEQLVHNQTSWPKDISVKPLSAYVSQKEKAERLYKYKKVIWVRNPLIRLVSAWNSKLRGSNQYYYKTVGKKIIAKYRNRTKRFMVEPESYKNDSSVTLEEFFLFLQSEVKETIINDAHWNPYHTICLPCHVDYDYIGKLENWSVEADFIFKTNLRTSEMYENYLKSKRYFERQASNDDIWKNMLKELPRSLLNSVKRTYLTDFDLFGYNSHEFD